MNQELLNSEPNMIIFRKKVQCKANLVIEMSRQCYVNMCVLQMTGKNNKCLVKALTISKSGLSSFSLSFRISVSIASLIASLHAYKSDDIKVF